MASINLADLTNAKTDVAHIADLALSSNATAVDRLGNTKSTMKGAIDTLKAFNSRGLWLAGTAYAVKDLVTSGGTWYVCVLAHTSSAAFAADSSTRWRVHQGLTAQSLADSQYARGIVNMANYATLKDAIAALPAGGGVVEIPVGRYPAGVWKFDSNYMAKPNVTLRGVQMPSLSYSCDRLQGGSIIEGRFNVFADNLTVENVGFDCGKYVIDTYYGGLDTHSPNHPNGDTWDGFAFAQPDQTNPLPQRRGFYAKNVIGLNRDSQSYGHAVLMEGFTGGYIDNVIGVGSIHALVIKASNVNVGYIAGYSASTDDIIIKSDRYAPCFNVKVAMLETENAAPGTSPWFAVADCQYSLLLNPATENMSNIKIGIARLHGALVPLAASGPMSAGPVVSPVYTLDNFKIESCEIEGGGRANVLGVSFTNLLFYRCSVDTLTVNNVADGIAYRQYSAAGGYGSNPLMIGTLRFGGSVTMRAIQCLGFGRIVVDNLLCDSTTAVLYAVEDTARIHVGRESITGILTTKFSNGAPALTAQWQQYAGNSSFRCILENYGVKFTGYLKPVGAGSGLICSLPPYLRTAQATRRLAYSQGTGGVDKSVVVNVDASYPYLAINNGISAAGAELALSLDGLAWSFD